MGIMDIRLALDVFEHPKTRELNDIFDELENNLGAVAVLSWLRLIIHAARNAPDGHLKVTTRRLATAARWPGDREHFADALIEVGLLERTDEGFRLHDFTDHQPWVVNSAERVKKAKKAAAARWSAPSNAPSMQRASSEHAPSNAKTKRGNAPTIPYQNLNRTEPDHKEKPGVFVDATEPRDVIEWFNRECCPPLISEKVITQPARWSVTRGLDSLRSIHGPCEDEGERLREYLRQAADVYSRADLPCRWGLANVLKEENMIKVINGYYEPKNDADEWIAAMKAKGGQK